MSQQAAVAAWWPCDTAAAPDRPPDPPAAPASPLPLICALSRSLSPLAPAAAVTTAPASCHRRRALGAHRRPSQPPKLVSEGTDRFLFASSIWCARSTDRVSTAVATTTHRSELELQRACGSVDTNHRKGTGRGVGSSDYGPTNTDPNEVEYVDR